MVGRTMMAGRNTVDLVMSWAKSLLFNVRDCLPKSVPVRRNLVSGNLESTDDLLSKTFVDGLEGLLSRGCCLSCFESGRGLSVVFTRPKALGFAGLFPDKP